MSYLSGWGRRAALIAAFGLVACGPSVALDDGAADTGSEDDSTGTGQSMPGSPGTTTTTPGTSTTTTPDDTVDGSGLEPDLPADGGSTFISDPTDGGCLCECSTFEQDCPTDEKCTPWANDGGSTWNAVRCTPIVEEPAGLGEPCTMEDSPVSGIDTCELGMMCWDVDPGTLEGTCIALCGGSPEEPECREGTECQLSADGPLALCLATCNPLVDDCDEGQQCVPVNAEFRCVAQAEAPLGYGEPCMFINDCGSGLTCLDGAVSECGDGACCTAFCNLSDGDPNPACPAAASGQTCAPWYDGEAPEGLENVGVCVGGGA